MVPLRLGLHIEDLSRDREAAAILAVKHFRTVFKLCSCHLPEHL